MKFGAARKKVKKKEYLHIPAGIAVWQSYKSRKQFGVVESEY